MNTAKSRRILPLAGMTGAGAIFWTEAALACAVCGFDSEPGFLWSMGFLIAMPFLIASVAGGCFFLARRAKP